MLLGRCGEKGRSGRGLVGLWLVRSAGWVLVGVWSTVSPLYGVLSLVYEVAVGLLLFLGARVPLMRSGASWCFWAIRCTSCLGGLSATSPRVAVRIPLLSLSRSRPANV